MFCTVAAQQAGEHIVGTASQYDTYVLIECPKPWPTKAFTAKGVPTALRKFIQETKAHRSVQFLCIAGQTAASGSKSSNSKVLIYEKAEHTLGDRNFSRGYTGYEFDLDGIEQVPNCVEAHWNQRHNKTENTIQTQDLLVCTHGMRDMCCARFGQPFYRQTKHLAKTGQLLNTRVWQVSHIGGHRFAPTVISLPDGRYYGRLTVEALVAIAHRSGPVQKVQPVYRGWGLLPQPVQVLEQRLFLQHGWSWLDNAVSYRCQTLDKPNLDKQQNSLQVDLSVQQPDNSVKTYHATLQRDTSQPYCVQASCSATVPTTFVKYKVTDCGLFDGVPSDGEPSKNTLPEASTRLQGRSRNSLVSSH